MNTIRKFWCLEGFVAIIFSIFTISALLSGSYLYAILMGIFSYWWIKRVLAKPSRCTKRHYGRDFYSHRDLDL